MMGVRRAMFTGPLSGDLKIGDSCPLCKPGTVARLLGPSPVSLAVADEVVTLLPSRPVWCIHDFEGRGRLASEQIVTRLAPG